MPKTRRSPQPDGKEMAFLPIITITSLKAMGFQLDQLSI
jgi:hypothetical protein